LCLLRQLLQIILMSAPEISASTREERLEFVKDEFKCMGNCRLCGNCVFLRGKEAEEVYSDYIEGKREYMDITKEWRDGR